jgi:hypothetical protein
MMDGRPDGSGSRAQPKRFQRRRGGLASGSGNLNRSKAELAE